MLTMSSSSSSTLSFEASHSERCRCGLEVRLYKTTTECSHIQRLISCPKGLENKYQFHYPTDEHTCLSCTVELPKLNAQILEQVDIIDDLEVTILELVSAEKTLRAKIDDQFTIERELVDKLEKSMKYVDQLEKKKKNQHLQVVQMRLVCLLLCCVLGLFLILLNKKGVAASKLMQLIP